VGGPSQFYPTKPNKDGEHDVNIDVNIDVEQDYLLLGLDGEDPGPTVVTLARIAHDIEEACYTGYSLWSRYVACVRDAEGAVALVPVNLETVDTSITNGISHTKWQVTVGDQVIGTLRTRYDLRV